MISLEVRVNGSLIAAASVVNRGPLDNGCCEYEAQTVLFPTDNAGHPTTRSFRCEHKRADGAMKLMKQIVEEML